MRPESVLIIDDEPQIRRLLKAALEPHGFAVFEAGTAEDGVAFVEQHNPDYVILDLSLPDLNGHDVLKSLRTWYTKPIIVISAQHAEENVVALLTDGADDYIRKPFGVKELLARLQLQKRRSLRAIDHQIIQTGALTIDLGQRRVHQGTNEVRLTQTEFALLQALAAKMDEAVPHQVLFREVWGPRGREHPQYLRVYIAHLRQKLESDPDDPRLIETVTGVGYRLRILPPEN